jgi:hypothetical protein
MLEPPPHAPIDVGSAPIAKVTNPAIVAAIATIATYVANEYFKVNLPADVAIAGVGLLCFAIAYLTPIKRREIRF